MDMGTASMSMTMTSTDIMSMSMGTTSSATATATAAAAAATSSMANMDMGGGSSCKVSMLWNWNTIDACFIARSWHIRSSGMFAGSCIGVVLLVMGLEFLRRLGKEYDRYILHQYQRSLDAVAFVNVSDVDRKDSSDPTNSCSRTSPVSRRIAPFRPHVLQQAIRATLHMLQFSVAYFIMLLAMYYNGYIIICIIIGAWIGSFIFSWETVDIGGPKEDATVCCG